MADNNKGSRFNTGKTRLELIPTFAMQKIGEVYTKGAHKYTLYENEQGERKYGKELPIEEIATGKWKVIDDGANNWRKGLNWEGVIGCIERHVAAFKAGEDIDPELGTYHLANAAWNAIALLEYYKIYPQGDNRQHKYLHMPKIGLDIDEVICNWVKAWIKYYDMHVPTSWFFDTKIMERFAKMKEDGTLDDFYLNLEPLCKPTDIPFEPHCYVTARPVDSEVTQRWLEKNGFPMRPIYTVEAGKSKIDVIKQSGIDIFVDDRYETFVELNKKGICCYLMDAPHNQRYNVGHKRIKSLKELAI